MSAEEWFSRDVVTILGLPFDVVDLAGAVRMVRSAVVDRRRCFVSTPNLNFAVAALKDTAFRSTVLSSDLCLADGAPIVRIGRWLGAPLPERVAGATVFEALLAHPGPAIRVFLFGGQPGVAAKAARTLNVAKGGLVCVGHEEAGFGAAETLGDAGTIDRINASGADFVIAALGARKGQAWLSLNASRLQAPVLCHLGAVLNFAAATLRRAPAWMQTAGLEWLWRISEEPELWRRYGSDAIDVARLIVGEMLPNAPRGPSSSEPPTLTIREDAGRDTWSLSGAWMRGGLDPLRNALVAADGRGGRIRLDLAQVRSIDAAFIGLLQLVMGRWGLAGIGWHSAPRTVSRAFRRSLVPACVS